MNRDNVKSDQLYTWSDRHERENSFISSKKTKKTPEKAASSRYNSQGILNRTLQTLRQTWLQMCPWPRARSEVLPLSQPLWKQAYNGLRPPGSPGGGQPLPRQFSQNSRDSGRSLLNQSGTSTPQRTDIGKAFKNRGQSHGIVPNQYPGTKRSCGKHAQRIPQLKFRGNFKHGGKA